MITFITRAAQTAFNQAGYDKMDAYQQASTIAQYILDHLEFYKARTGIDDEFELAYHIARDVVNYRMPIQRRLEQLPQ